MEATRPAPSRDQPNDISVTGYNGLKPRWRCPLPHVVKLGRIFSPKSAIVIVLNGSSRRRGKFMRGAAGQCGTPPQSGAAPPTAPKISSLMATAGSQHLVDSSIHSLTTHHPPHHITPASPASSSWLPHVESWSWPAAMAPTSRPSSTPWPTGASPTRPSSNSL